MKTFLLTLVLMWSQVALAAEWQGPDDVLAAARAGDPEAQLEMGILFEYGFNMPDHKVPALAWYMLSANQGNESAAQRRNKLQAELLPGEVERAREMMASIGPGRGGTLPTPMPTPSPSTPETQAPATMPEASPEPELLPELPAAQPSGPGADTTMPVESSPAESAPAQAMPAESAPAEPVGDTAAAVPEPQPEVTPPTVEPLEPASGSDGGVRRDDKVGPPSGIMSGPK